MNTVFVSFSCPPSDYSCVPTPVQFHGSYSLIIIVYPYPYPFIHTACRDHLVQLICVQIWPLRLGTHPGQPGSSPHSNPCLSLSSSGSEAVRGFSHPLWHASWRVLLKVLFWQTSCWDFPGEASMLYMEDLVLQLMAVFVLLLPESFWMVCEPQV